MLEKTLAGGLKTAPQAVIRRCVTVVNAQWNRQEAGNSKLKAWPTGSEFVLSLKPLALR
jgi:hypothetical protein